jgi:S1-C subfamily serine protease
VARVSDRHDVAMLKIDIPEPLKKIDLNDNYDTIKPGDAVSVLGYPGGSPPEIAIIGSKSRIGASQDQLVGIIPNATLSVGNISRVVRGQEAAPGKDAVVSLMGDYFQLTINTTGGGNSGGPVLDDQGRAIAIFTHRVGSDFHASGAVPIRYAKELMGVTAIMK